MSTSTHQGDDKVHTEDSKTETKYKLLFNSYGMMCSVLLIKQKCAVTAVTHPHCRPFILPFYATRSKKVFKTKIKLLLAASFSFACEMIHHLACSAATVLIWYLAVGYYPKYINLIRNRYCQSFSTFSFWNDHESIAEARSELWLQSYNFNGPRRGHAAIWAGKVAVGRLELMNIFISRRVGRQSTCSIFFYYLATGFRDIQWENCTKPLWR